MTNFLQETKAAIKGSGHLTSNVLWVGSKDAKYRIGWRRFTKLANFDYNSGYGSQKIATDLVVAFDDGQYLYRGEYDGSEWWEYLSTLDDSGDYKGFNILGGEGYSWECIESMNQKGRE